MSDKIKLIMDSNSSKILLLILLFVIDIFPQWSTDPNSNLIVGYGLDPHICSDSSGGCYVTYDYESTSYPRKLALERLDKYGYKPWGTKKQILGELPGQWRAQIVEDGTGGVIISYQDRWEEFSNWTERIRVQRVDSSGNFLWGQTGIRVTLEEINQGSQKIVSDGNGGAVIVWVNTQAEYKVNRISSTGERMWGDSGIVLGINGYYDPAILVRTTNNKYVASAERNTYMYFDENGNMFYSGSVVWLENIISDAYGGIIITSRGGQWPLNWQLRAQRKDSLGNSLWQEPHIVVADSVVPNSVIFILQNQGYYFFSWKGKFNSFDYLLYQGLRFDGSKLLPSSSFVISDVVTNITSIPIIKSDSLSNVIIWTNSNELKGTWGQRIDTVGIKKWREENKLLNYPELNYLNVTTDCYGGAIGIGYLNADLAIRVFKISVNGNLGEVIIPVELISFSANVTKDKVELFWQTATETNNLGFEILRFAMSDKEWNTIDFIPGFGTTSERKSYSFIDKKLTKGIYKYRLKQIDFDGSIEYSSIVEIAIGAPTEFLLEQNFPNPFNSSTIIKYQIPQDEHIRINLYNILGELLQTITEGLYEAGYYQTEFNAENLPSGIYIYRMESGESLQSKKMILIR